KTKTLPKLKENSIKTPDLLILDGQQRLTSLQRLLKGEIPVYFNVEDESFVIYSSKLKNVPSWVSVKSVLENPITVWNRIIENLKIDKTSPLQEVYMNRIQNLSQIKDYSFPVLTLHTDDFEEVTESFIRLNSKGTRLKFAELAMARLAFNWPGALNDEFKIALTEYENINFDFSPSFLMRCFVVIGTDQSSFKTLDTLWNERKSNLPSIWEKTKKSIDTTINFLKNNVGIGSSNFIPSTNALVPIVYYVNKLNSKLDDGSINGILFGI
ncbi:GmrSD restriction endonuclease domain-containing protein, partial [Leptospira borgpetersenii]|uniref:GmrSD restriction endonuclease domain-containing protein n=1 Tax=Leptospira borgpetersenii TaxID=174 RepID=UPI001D135721